MRDCWKVLLAGALCLPVLAFAQAASCDAKRASVEKEIQFAQTHGNANRVAGLETALASLNANCTDAALQSARQRKVADAQKRLAERERALQQAKAEGRGAKKIRDRQRKVDEAHADLEQAQTEAAQ